MSGYGSQEYVCRIMECEQGSFHLNPEYGIMEIIGDNGLPAKTGRLVATGFANKVMPLIRYDTGDIAEWADAPCACGRESPIVGRIIGRIEDHILTPEGFTIGHIPVRHFLSTNVIESQIYQPDLHNIVMRIVKDSKYTTKDEASMLQGLRKMVGPSLNIRFEYMETLPRTIGGKLRAIVSDVNQNNFEDIWDG
jgi:phenylacetate-CoA ligase